jgi:hypothetical protein
VTIDLKSFQTIIAYASIVMGVLTTQLQGIHLPTAASVILGVFGILLHPQTSVTSNEGAAKPPAAPGG